MARKLTHGVAHTFEEGHTCHRGDSGKEIRGVVDDDEWYFIRGLGRGGVLTRYDPCHAVCSETT